MNRRNVLLLLLIGSLALNSAGGGILAYRKFVRAPSAQAKVVEIAGNPGLPVARDEAEWLTRHGELIETILRERPEIWFIGDSIVEGWRDKGKEAWEKNFGSWSAVNLGIARDRTEHVLYRLSDVRLKNHQPKLIIILIGTNNLTYKKLPEQIAYGITKILEFCSTRFPDTLILLLGVLPRSDEFSYPVYVLNEKLKKNEKSGSIIFKDYRDLLLNMSGVIKPGVIEEDGVHLTSKGYRLLSSEMGIFLNFIMNNRKW